MARFINNKAVKLFLNSIVYLAVFFVAKVIYFDKGSDILNLGFIILPFFIVNGFLPPAYKPYVFPALFLAISFYVFSSANAIILFLALSVISFVLISGLQWIYKLIFVIVVFIGLFLLQSGRLQIGSFNYAVPFLASILMFKVIIALYEFKYNNTVADKPASRSYFFSFQQLFFPVMPIVDHKHFLNGRDQKQVFFNQDKAVTQFVTGIFLFSIYKIVNQEFSPSVYNISNSADLMLYIISKSIILFKLVGVFIFSVGFFSMFDINLPSSFGFFPLASTFRDYWKDVNRFWRDFILKIIYYPLFFKLKKSKFIGKGILLIVITFMSSCFFHFYQLYWSTGYFKFKMTDVLYWLLLGLLVFYSGYRFEKQMNQPPVKESGFLTFVRRSFSVLFVQVVMNFLFFIWTTESIGEVVFLIKQGCKFSVTSLLLLFIYWLIFCCGIVIKDAITKTKQTYIKIVSIFRYGFLGTVLLLYCFKDPQNSLTRELFTADYLTVNQHESNEEGYYTRLMASNSNSKMGKEGNIRVSPLSKISFSSNTVLRQELMPSQSIRFNGTVISTNKLGLRDKEYDLEKGTGITRVAILGASYEMGTGVNNNEVFEGIAEEWLNKFSGRKFELLNFGVPMYSVIQNAYVLEHKASPLKPDMAILFSHTGEEQRLCNNVTRLVKEGFTFDDVFINFMLENAGIEKRMSALEIKYRLKPHMNRLFDYLYKKMVAFCENNRIKPVWVFLPTTNEVIADDNRINNLKDLAKNAGFETYSLKRIYSNYSKESITVSNVDPHPNALGHVLIAGGVYQIINEPQKTIVYE